MQQISAPVLQSKFDAPILESILAFKTEAGYLN